MKKLIQNNLFLIKKLLFQKEIQNNIFIINKQQLFQNKNHNNIFIIKINNSYLKTKIKLIYL